MPVPYTFATATSSIPLSQLDNNFATAITIGNTAVQLGNTITTINNATLANVTISSVSTPVTIAQGGTGATTLAGANIATLNNAGTFTATQTFSGSTSTLAEVITNGAEVVTINASGAGNTINYDITTQSVLYYTANATSNQTLNFRASSGTSLNTALSTNNAVTIVYLVTNGSTAYYPSTIQIDGSAVTPKWQGGTAVSSGNTSATDIYSFTIIKTASATFTVLASQTKFA